MRFGGLPAQDRADRSWGVGLGSLLSHPCAMKLRMDGAPRIVLIEVRQSDWVRCFPTYVR